MIPNCTSSATATATIAPTLNAAASEATPPFAALVNDEAILSDADLVLLSMFFSPR
jgi:hypothetical protein